MRLAVVLVMLFTASASALEPTEVYRRAAAATVRIRTDRASGTGFVVDLEKGLVLTHREVVAKAERIEVTTRGKTTLGATRIDSDVAHQLALLEVPGLQKSGVSALPFAPMPKKASKIKGRRVYTVRGEWRFSQGILGDLRPASPGAHLVFVHDCTTDRGGPLLDTEARLLGLNLADSKSIPVSDLKGFLERERRQPREPREPRPEAEEGLGFLDRNRGEPEEPRKPEPRVSLPRGLAYGPYRHALKSRERRALEVRVNRMLKGIAGVFYRCPRCEGVGTVLEIIRPGFRREDGTYVDPAVRVVDCPRCRRAGKLFDEGKAEGAFRDLARAEQGGPEEFGKARREFMERLFASGRSYTRTTRFAVEVEGRYGVVRGARNNPFFPLHFKLQRRGAEYEWYLHDPRINGPFDFRREAGQVPAQALVAGVAAGDIVLLDDGTIVRICGIAVPGRDGKLPKEPLPTPVQRVRALVEKELVGKTVRLRSDKYSRVSCDGHAIAFLEVDGEDYGELLLRRGLVRRHPKHIHMRNHRYKKAETAAKRAGVGIWRK